MPGSKASPGDPNKVALGDFLILCEGLCLSATAKPKNCPTKQRAALTINSASEYL